VRKRVSVGPSNWLKWTVLGFLSAMVFDLAYSRIVGLIYAAWNDPEAFWIGQYTFVQFGLHYAVLFAVQSLAFPASWGLRRWWIGGGAVFGVLGTSIAGMLGISFIEIALLVAVQLVVLVWRLGWRGSSRSVSSAY